MEFEQIDDIRNNTTLNLVRQLKDSIIDCAKNIKSNDATFHISTLPTVNDKLTNLMGSYVRTAQQVKSCQEAFSKLNEAIQKEEEADKGQSVDLDTYSKLFEEAIKEKSDYENGAYSELEKIIGPVNEDEEIRIEAPSRQIPKDPITKKDIKVAVKSNVCKHIFDKDGIENYFLQKEKAKKTRIQCPQAGCTNRSMTRSELVLDEETNRLIQSL